MNIDHLPAAIPTRNGLTAYVFADAKTLGTVLGGLAYVVGGIDLLLLVVFTGSAFVKSGNPLWLLAFIALAAAIFFYSKYSTEYAK